MFLFENRNDSLIPLEQDPFKLEKDMQSLVEANLSTLFVDLQFISSEFSIGEYRLDTLAFNEQDKSFVIIEYKRGSSYSVIDQGYAYLATLLERKADFLLEYHEKTGKRLKKEDVDWISSRVIFVSTSFNNYQKSSLNFKGLPFELWEIRRFDGGFVALEECRPSSNVGTRELPKGDAGSEISKVSSQVAVKSVEDHVKSLGEHLKPVWGTLKDKLEAFPDTDLNSRNNYVAWRRNDSAVCYIRFYRQKLLVEIVRGTEKAPGEFSRKYFRLDDPKQLAEEKPTNYQGGTRHYYYITPEHSEDVDYVMFLLEQKYNSLD